MAGEFKEGKRNKRRVTGIPSNCIMMYLLDAKLFKKVCDDYPAFRSFVIARSLVRRSFFKKTFEDNKQVLLLRNKQHQHWQLVQKYGIENDYIQKEEDQ